MQCLLLVCRRICVSLHRCLYQYGQLSMNRRHIMKTYCRTWLLFDIVVITLDWLSIIFLSRSASSFWMRLFRGVRFVRLARLVKFETMFHKYFEMGNAPSELVLLVQVFLYVGGMILFTHLLACVWYAIGLSSDKAGCTNTCRTLIYGMDISQVFIGHSVASMAPWRLRHRPQGSGALLW